MYKCDVRL